MGKFCPVMGITSGVIAYAAANGGMDSKEASEISKLNAFACVGSNCAWWRPIKDEAVRPTTALENGNPVEWAVTHTGVCGIAGINHSAAFDDPAQEKKDDQEPTS
jgi:hypothetical protein